MTHPIKAWPVLACALLAATPLHAQRLRDDVGGAPRADRRDDGLVRYHVSEATFAEMALLPPVEQPAYLPGDDYELPVPAAREFDAAYPSMPPPNKRLPFARDDGPSIRIFEPKARIYFDRGDDAPDKLDIFQDGSLVPSINFLEVYWPRPFYTPLGRRDWRWGPAVGVGLTSQADDSPDGTVQASGAPVLMVSAGLQCEFTLGDRQVDEVRRKFGNSPEVEGLLAELRYFAPTAGVEVGYAVGVSTDEGLDDISDGAIYVGVTLHVLP